MMTMMTIMPTMMPMMMTMMNDDNDDADANDADDNDCVDLEKHLETCGIESGASVHSNIGKRWLKHDVDNDNDDKKETFQEMIALLR